MKLNNLSGCVFGRWTVSDQHRSKNGQTYWFCECSCGKSKWVYGCSLTDGNSQSCGCLIGETARKSFFQDLSGKTIGNWTVSDQFKHVPECKVFRIYWLCSCICGNQAWINCRDIKKRPSCGCLRSWAALPGEEFKKCRRCENEKPIEEFSDDKDRPDGKKSQCKSCEKELREQRRNSDPSIYERQLAYHRKWSKDNKEHVNSYIKNRRDSDPNVKIASILRTRIREALKKNRKCSKSLILVACSVDQLWEHLERSKTWDRKMTRENLGSYWHIDHIIPCAEFDLTDSEEQKRCFHYANLRPLKKEDNWKKGSKLLFPQMSLLLSY